MPLHSAFYDRRSTASAVVPLHACQSVALSMLPADEDTSLPPLTPYGLMKLGRVKLLPFFSPGDPAMGAAAGDNGLAAVPDRGAPDHGALDDAHVLAELARLGYGCPIGAEFKRSGETEASLGWMARYS